MQTLHRARDRLVGERTALINQLRAILLERGITVPQGRTRLERHLTEMFDGNHDDSCPLLTPRLRVLIEDMRAQWHELDRRIVAFEEEFVSRAREDAAARRLISIPGIGVMNATALIAAIGTGEAFRRGRDLAAWLRLVPRQITTGGRPRLVGISKRGSKYRNWGITPGSKHFWASPDAGEYDSVGACRHSPPRPVYHAPSLKLGSRNCWTNCRN
jgi:transposase